ncbi:MAG: hypothetical protein RQ745_07400 [Longimicrobiales bacterium]|nr:hypothetical protein [Longimicrobiales bacterium]
MHRLPIVGVMGSSREPHPALAEPLGAWLATLGVHLLTGAGQGVMETVSRAFAEVAGRRGSVIGVCPARDEDPGRTRAGYPNRWVEVVIRTHLPLSGPLGTEDRSRNHVNILSSDVIVALPGSDGTASEVRLAQRYGRPVIAFVHARTEIPQLAAGVSHTSELAVVQRFVREALPGAAASTTASGGEG